MGCGDDTKTPKTLCLALHKPMRRTALLCCLLALCLQIISGVFVLESQVTCSSMNRLLGCRGGAVRAKKGRSLWNRNSATRKPSNSAVPDTTGPKFIKESTASKIKDAVLSLKPVSRWYIYLILSTAAIHMSGLPAPKLFALNARKPWELWRVISSASYLGGPSLSLANNIFFLVTYGQLVENAYGSADFAYFLAVEMAILSGMSLLLRFPFTAQSMLSSVIYLSSRINALDSVPFQFGLTITSWQVPFCMMIIDCLAQQSIAAAWPHVLGILSGHIYHFFHDVWPRLGGKQYFSTPAYLTSFFQKKKLKK